MIPHAILTIEALLVSIGIHVTLLKIYNGELKKGFKIVMLYAILVVYGIASIIIQDLTELLSMSFAFFCIILPVFSIQKMKRGDVLFISVLFSGFVTGIVALVSSILDQSEMLRFIHIAVNCLLLVAYVLVSKNANLRNKLQTLIYASGKVKFLLCVATWIGFFFIYIVGIIAGTYEHSSLIRLMVAISILIFFIMLIMLPSLVMNNISSLKYKTALANANMQITNQTKYYNAIATKTDELRKFKHDYNNLQIALHAYLLKGNTRAALKYLSVLKGVDTSGEHLSFNTGNDLLDVLLSDKQILADEINTRIEFKGMLPTKLIAPRDICIIFGNAIDNAIEACSKLPLTQQKTIDITCDYAKRLLLIKITNPIETRVHIFSNNIQSTKTDGGFHGIGLASIKDAVSIYSGEVHLLSEDKIFIFEAYLDFNTYTLITGERNVTCDKLATDLEMSGNVY